MKKIGMLKTYSSSEIEKSYVSIDFSTLDRDLFRADKCYDLLAASGVKYARCQTGWAKTEKQKGVYDFGWLDEIIDNLCSRGIKPWLSVSYGNPIYMPDAPNSTAVGCVPLYYGDETLNAWKNFVRAVAERYKDRVEYFEVWNEPDGVQFWYPSKPSGAEFARLTNITAGEILKVYPEAKIVVNVSHLSVLDYIGDFLDNVNKNCLHVYAYHVYSRVPECGIAESVAELRRMLDERELSHVQIWQGEGGYPSWAYEGHWLVNEGCDDERPQAVYQLRRYFIDISLGTKLSSFFQMADMWEKPYEKATETLKKCAAHGVLNGLIYTPKKSYQTITHLAAIFSGDIEPTNDYIVAGVTVNVPIDTLSIMKMSFKKNGLPVFAYYYPSDLSKETKVECNANISILKNLAEPVLIDTFTGDVFEVDTASNSGGIYRYSLPICDYPLILTEKKAFEIKGE